MKPAIYDQHDKAFSRVSAFIVAKDGERVATVAIKFPADGASRLYAYVHWLGVPMVRGAANGYGYDKRSAAVADAVRKMPTVPQQFGPDAHQELSAAFRKALDANSGDDWTRALEKAGFTVWQAI